MMKMNVDNRKYNKRYTSVFVVSVLEGEQHLRDVFPNMKTFLSEGNLMDYIVDASVNGLIEITNIRKVDHDGTITELDVVFDGKLKMVSKEPPFFKNEVLARPVEDVEDKNPSVSKQPTMFGGEVY